MRKRGGRFFSLVSRSVTFKYLWRDYKFSPAALADLNSAQGGILGCPALIFFAGDGKMATHFDAA
jgi:hypothetical protein